MNFDFCKILCIFFLIINLLKTNFQGQLLMQGKKLKNREQWIKIAKDYGRSVLTGTLVSTTGMQLVCLFR